MNSLILLALASSALSGASVVSGTVTDSEGAPLEGARVFIETGRTGPIVETATSADGAFRFDGVQPGIAGVVAFTPGLAFGGTSVSVAIEDQITDLRISLGEPGELNGRVTDVRGDPIAGAGVTRVLIEGEPAVGIPLSKLKPLGFEVPVTNSAGRFTLRHFPKGSGLILKIVHTQYAQEAAGGLIVGQTSEPIIMYRGVLVTGDVLARGTTKAVANAAVVISSALPPHDSAVVNTAVDGTFGIRLKPGAYSGQAMGVGFRTPSGHRFVVSGEYLTQQVRLYVSGAGGIAGKVMDAKSGDPIEDASVVLHAHGIRAAVERTGPGGEYRFAAAEGESIIRVESAPGHMIPLDSGMKVTVVTGQVVALPTFWLASTPIYSLSVFDENDAPVQGAIVQVLRPAQFGWYATDAQGHVELSFGNLPADGTVIGRVDHLEKPAGALFAISREGAHEATVTLFPLSRVTGSVVDEDGPVEGALVSGRYRHENIEAMQTLWSTLTSKDGSFAWDGILAHVPQLCTARNPQDGGSDAAQSESFIVGPDELKVVPEFVIPVRELGRSSPGRTLAWYDNPPQCAATGNRRTLRNRPAAVVYCQPRDADMVVESLAKARALFKDTGILFAVVVDGPASCSSESVLILRGKRPKLATTYLIDHTGKIVLETFGMPPVHGLQTLADSRAR